MKNTGSEYEKFVGLLQQALLDAETFTQQRNIEVQVNKKIIDACGIERQFDLYWEYELAGITYKTVIECKDYASAIPVEKIDAMIGKIRDIPDLKAVFATRTGYQSGAKTKAETNKVDLLIVREQNDDDWIDIDGTPYVKSIHIRTHVRSPATITQFEPLVDGEWAQQQDVPPDLEMCGNNDEIFIEDGDTNTRFSIYQMAEKLADNHADAGTYSSSERFSEAWIVGPGFRSKIKGFNVSYVTYPIHHNEIVIDLTKEVVGVIEYLQKGVKKTVLKEGIIKEAMLPSEK